MTIQQLRYVIAISECGSLNKASEKLYISQPSLSQSLKDLETEIDIQIFNRGARGLSVTSKGEEFLTYARQTVEQFILVEDKFINKKEKKKNFSVSTQHYSFAVKAFINTVKHFDLDDYELSIKETKTFDIINDVKNLRSELGILYQNHFNKTILSKIFKDYDLTFTKLFTCKIFVYIHKENPLASKAKITLDELQNYPCLSFEQSSSFYFSEEVLSTYSYKQLIKVTDRATMLNLMKGLNAYTLCSGIISEDLNGSEYVAIELDSDETMDIGYIQKSNVPISATGTIYIDELNQIYTNS